MLNIFSLRKATNLFLILGCLLFFLSLASASPPNLIAQKQGTTVQVIGNLTQNITIFNGTSYNVSYETWLTNYTLYSPYWYNHTADVNTLWGKWFYNMSDGSYNITYQNFAYNQTYSGSTYNSTYNQWSYNQSDGSYNSTYNNLLNYQCPSGQAVNGTYSNGTFTCVAMSAGGSSGGWTNDSTTANTLLNVNINGTLTIHANETWSSTAKVINITDKNGANIFSCDKSGFCGFGVGTDRGGINNWDGLLVNRGIKLNAVGAQTSVNNWTFTAGTPGNYDGWLKISLNETSENTFAVYIQPYGGGTVGAYAFSSFNYEASTYGRGDSQIMTWTNPYGASTGNGLLSLGEDYPTQKSSAELIFNGAGFVQMRDNNPGRVYWIMNSSRQGILTTNPSATLDVNGSTNVQGNVSILSANLGYPLSVGNSSTGISGYFVGSVSADRLITRSNVYDKNRGLALGQIKDSSAYVDSNGDINHSAFGYSAVVYQKQVIDKITPYSLTKEVCNETIKRNGNPANVSYVYNCVNITTTEQNVTYKNVNEEGIDLVAEVALLKQAIFELKTQNIALKQCAAEKDYTSYQTCVARVN